MKLATKVSLALLASATVVFACSDDDGLEPGDNNATNNNTANDNDNNAPVTRIAITPEALSLDLGGFQQLTVIGTFEDGTTGDVTRRATFSSDSPSVATAGPSGTVIGAGEGVAVVTATIAGVSDTIEVNVGGGSQGIPLPMVVSDNFSAAGFFPDNNDQVNVEPTTCPGRPMDARGTCYEFTYDETDTADLNGNGFAGVIWLNGEGFGNNVPLLVAPGATQVSFYAWGAVGGERVTFGYNIQDGGPGASSPQPETLTTTPTRFTIPITADYETVEQPFFWSAGLNIADPPIRFFIDDIVWEKGPEAPEPIQLPMVVSDHFAAAGFFPDDVDQTNVEPPTCPNEPTDALGLCYEFFYEETVGDTFAGVIWLNGDSFDNNVPLPVAPGAAQLSFYAWGEAGGEVVTFGYNIPDSPGGERQVTLSTTPTRIIIPISPDFPYTTIEQPFFWSAGLSPNESIRFYVTDIQWTGANLETIFLGPDPANLLVDETRPLLPLGTFNDGSRRLVTDSATFQSSDTAVATIDETGVVTARAIGTATITVTADGISDTSVVNVTAPRLPLTLPLIVDDIFLGRAGFGPNGPAAHSEDGGCPRRAGDQNGRCHRFVWDGAEAFSGTFFIDGTGFDFVNGQLVETGAEFLAFWAWGENGGEVIVFGAGLGGNDVGEDRTTFTLTRSPTLYEIPLTNNLGYADVFGPFVWSADNVANPNGFTFYVDDIQWRGPIIGSRLSVVSISPNPVRLLANEAQALTVFATFDDGRQQDVTNLATIVSDNEAVATVVNGRVFGVSPGTANITATFDGVSGTVEVSVGELASLAISPDLVRTRPGRTDPLTVTAIFDNGLQRDVTVTATYRSDDESIATVDSAGQVTAVAAGITTVTASVAGFIDTVEVSVLTPLPLPMVVDDNYRGRSGFGPPPGAPLFTEDNLCPIRAYPRATGDCHRFVWDGIGGFTGLFFTEGSAFANLVNKPIAPGATVLSFYAWSDTGGRITFGAGLDPDAVEVSGDPREEVELDSIPRLITIALGDGDNYDFVLSPFTWLATTDANPGGVTFFVDDIKWRSGLLTRIDVTPNPVNIFVDDNRALAVTGNFDDGSIADITGNAAFESNNPQVADVDDQGVVSGVAIGTATITVSAEGFTNTVLVTVARVPVLTGITVTPNPVTISVDDSQPLTVTGNFDNGSESNLTSTAMFEPANPQVVSVDSAGVVEGVAVGETTISVTASGFTDTVSVTVNPPGVLTSITITPDPVTITRGNTQALTVTGNFDNGAMADVTSQASFTTSSAIVVVDSDGNVTGVEVGMATVTAMVGDLTDDVSVEVTPAPTAIALPMNVGDFFTGRSNFGVPYTEDNNCPERAPDASGSCYRITWDGGPGVPDEFIGGYFTDGNDFTDLVGRMVEAGATQLSFYAWGAAGGEVIDVGAGFPEPQWDGAAARDVLTLTTEPTPYTVPLSALTRYVNEGIVFGPFIFAANDGANPNGIEIYFDSIQWVRAARTVRVDSADTSILYDGGNLLVLPPNAGGSDVGNPGGGAVYVMPFQIPPIPAGGFTTANLTVSINFNNAEASATANADLYGLPFRSTADVTAAQFFAGPSDTSATLIADNFLTPGTASGPLMTDAAASAALVQYLNAQVRDNGAAAGDYVFLRLNPDVTTDEIGAGGAGLLPHWQLVSAPDDIAPLAVPELSVQ